MTLDEAFAADLADLERGGLRRRLPEPDVGLLMLGSNDYLGLAGHPAVREAAAAAAREWGAGSGGSRLTSGNLGLHEALEAELADWQGTEAAVLFPSGYQAAVGTIPALVGAGDLILSDALNHACLIDGMRLSRAEVRVYRHADAGHAAELLRDRGAYRRALVVSDGVFSMDGDLAPLPALADVCRQHDAWLMVDDAHGGGVLGPAGVGAAAHLGVAGRVDIRMGTLSKALGAEGGYVAGSAALADWLRNRARSFVFSTAAAPPVVAAARAGVELARAGEGLRERLAHNGRVLRDALAEHGVAEDPGVTPIIPVLIGDAAAAVAAARRLAAEGVWAPAIRPPTVPPGSSRLRLSVTAAHEEPDLRRAAAAVAAAVRSGG
jgi:8-amino-7-oxononanoate synthase